MSATLDVNVLLYASDEASTFYPKARALLAQVASGPELVYLFWPTVVAFMRISTHASIFEQPLSAQDAADNISQLLDRPHVQSPAERETFWDRYREVASEANATGNLAADAHIVALMLENGVRTIWTHDRDFRRFRGIEVRDPFD